MLELFAAFAFFQCPSLAVNIENFKMIVHLHCISGVNGFGAHYAHTYVVSHHGLYYGSNFANHSCSPNTVVVNRGREQFLVAIKKIRAGDPITISYIDTGFEHAD
jgi:hypothetical protein